MLTTYQLPWPWHDREEACKTNNKILLLLYSSHDPGTPPAPQVSQAHSVSLSIPVGTVSRCARAPPVRSQKLMCQVRYRVDFYICIKHSVSAAPETRSLSTAHAFKYVIFLESTPSWPSLGLSSSSGNLLPACLWEAATHALEPTAVCHTPSQEGSKSPHCVSLCGPKAAPLHCPDSRGCLSMAAVWWSV